MNKLLQQYISQNQFIYCQKEKDRQTGKKILRCQRMNSVKLNISYLQIPIIIYDSMKFQHLQTDYKPNLFHLTIRIFQLEDENRTRLTSLITFLLYLLDYALIFCIVVNFTHSLQYPSTYLTVAIVQGLRAFFNVTYLVLKKKAFLLLGRICLFISFFLKNPTQGHTYAILLILDLFVGLVWVLSIQQRNLFFDSRLFLEKSAVKQLLSRSVLVLQINFQNGSGLIREVNIILLLVIFLAIDLTTYYYDERFRRFLTILDLELWLFSYLFLFENHFFINKSVQIIIVYLVSFVFLMISVYFWVDNFSGLYINMSSSQNPDEKVILKYVICLENLIRSQSTYQMNKFLTFHTLSCSENDCFLRFDQSSRPHQKQRLAQALRIFRKDQIIKLSKRYAIIQYYLSFNFQTTFEKSLSIKNLNHFFQFRQNWAFEKKSLKSKDIINNLSFMLNPEVDIIPNISSYIKTSLQFWEQFIQPIICTSKFVEYGTKQLEILSDIDKLVEKKSKFTQKSQIVINYFFKYILCRASNIVTERNYIEATNNYFSSLNEAPPSVLISADNSTLFDFVNCNLAVQKLTGFTKKELLSIKASNLWQKQIKQEHIKMLESKSRYCKSNERSLVRLPIFIKNKFGFVILAEATTYFYEGAQGKRWCVMLQPILQSSALLVCNMQREIMGINQNCLHLGLDKNLRNLKLNESVFNQLYIEKKNMLKIRKNELIQGNYEQESYKNFTITIKTQMQLKGKVRYLAFSIVESQSKNPGEFDLQSLDNLNFSRKSGFNAAFDIDQSLSYQFTYNFKKNQFVGESGQLVDNKKSIFFKSERLNQQSQQEQEVKKNMNYAQDIIQMRLWKSEIDFVQNLQPLLQNFEPIPSSHKVDQIQMTLQNAKQNYETRLKFVPSNIKHVRGILAIALSSILIIFIYTTVMNSLNRKQKLKSLEIQLICFKQSDYLFRLSTTIIKKKIDKSIQFVQEMNQNFEIINAFYKKIQLQYPQLDDLIRYQQDGDFSLIKLDELYRLFIGNLMKQTEFTPSNVDPVLSHLLEKLGFNWQRLKKNLFVKNKIDLEVNKRDQYICLGALFLALTTLIAIYHKLVTLISMKIKQVCRIVMEIDHRSVIAHTVKLKSFSKYIDYGSCLQVQQNIQEIRNKETLSFPYSKRIIQDNKETMQSSLFFISIFLALIFFLLLLYMELNISKNYEQNIDFLYYSTTIQYRFQQIWASINRKQIDLPNIMQMEQNLISLHRQFQNRTMDPSTFLIDLSPQALIVKILYGSICHYSKKCSDSFKLFDKDGQKSQALYFLRVLNQVLDQYQIDEKVIKTDNFEYLYRFSQFYSKEFVYTIQDTFFETFKSLQIYHEEFTIKIMPFLILSVIGFIVWYKIFYKRVCLINSLQQILTCLPFKILKNNRKYLQYLEKVKIKER